MALFRVLYVQTENGFVWLTRRLEELPRSAMGRHRSKWNLQALAFRWCHERWCRRLDHIGPLHEGAHIRVDGAPRRADLGPPLLGVELRSGPRYPGLLVADERRGARRIPVQLRVRFKDIGRPRQTFDEVTRDISGGGIFVETTVVFAVGTTVEVEVDPIGQGPTIFLKAEVVRVEEEPGELGSIATVGMRSRGLALRLMDADPDALIRLLSSARQGGRVTSDMHVGAGTG